MKQIFPKEILDSTIHVHQFKHSKKSKIIYSIIILAFLALIISLPFIKISIYNTSQGIIKPDKDRIAIQTVINGKITYQKLRNNSKVFVGDTLLIIENSAVEQKIKTIQRQVLETQSFTNDLNLLIANQGKLDTLISLKFKREFGAYQQKLRELNRRYKKIKDDYNRNTSLYNKGVIAKIALENSKLEFDLALGAIFQYKKQQKSSWQTQLVTYNNQLDELTNTISQLKENSSMSLIKAPITGTLLNVKAMEEGSFVNAGVQLAEISPDTEVLVECYIVPSEIGLLKKGASVNFQIAAFNYNQWGLATGKIIDIGNDVQIINNTPVFRILCSIDQEYLALKNGFKGYLKKGMTVNTRFKLTERSLFDLLYDKMDDWLNPSTQVSMNN